LKKTHLDLILPLYTALCKQIVGNNGRGPVVAPFMGLQLKPDKWGNYNEEKDMSSSVIFLT